jgi:arsenate reductase (thioredoxin)
MGVNMTDGESPVFDDPATQHFIRQGIVRLRDEFRGIFSEQTIQRFVDEAMASLAGARIKDYVPLFVNRFARERLQALAQVQGKLTKDVPEVLFVCVHNAGRSQMAAGLLNKRAAGRVHVRSAGSTPADEINPAAVAALAEVGIDLSQEFPKPLTDEFVRAADVVITMGCGDACPIYPGKRYEDWEVADPAGQRLERVRQIRDDIERRVQVLLESLVGTEVAP